ncbi:SusC/RagA family TonB-linked outer membrane protein [uncultured Winogradskyella sp.]|uniref:SusC/RagA family TonB-linked outer membrane protein n=1 Tax=uncultured Winogradskyella sp. TaxID=395353 RepID=UPI0030D96C5A|tara:strand:+ start:85754 stop:88657 length:2904 start_codon:yes stop_codon:yes gene_type:complete
MKTFLNALLLCLIMVPATLVAQSTVSGTVTDKANAMPLPGVNVIIKGTSRGQSTNIDGKYTIEVNQGETLVVSFLGYTTQEIVFNGQTLLDIALVEDAAQLDEVVLIGYGSTTKQDATGAVEKVSAKEFNRGAIVAPQQLIAGKASGVRVTSGGGGAGEGGEIRIRGGASLSATNDPLIVIDGLPIDQRGGAQGSRNALNAINPADIEDFVVLKDASATAIYGSRASNGVILITTKKGSANQPLTFEYGLQASTRRITNTVDVLSANQYRALASNPDFDSTTLGNANTNWQDEIYSTGVGAIHNLTVSKGYENFNFRVNLNHVSQEGPLQDLYERNGINTSFVHRFLDNDLKLSLVTKMVQDEFSYANQGAIGAAIAFDPTQSVLDENGNFTQYGAGANLAPANPLFLLDQYDDRQTIKRVISNFNIDYRFWFLKELRFNLNAGIDYAENDGHKFVGANPNNPDAFNTNEVSSGLNRNTALDFYLNYKKNIESINTSIDVTAGHAFQEFYIKGFFDRTTNTNISQTDINRNALESYFARASFDIADKYLVSLSYRRDGSSRFSENNRWGNFPGASFGWKIMNEDFMQDSFFSNLKLRAGWGVTGQQEFGQNYGYLGIYTPSRNDAANIQIGTQPNGDPIFISTLRPEGFDENLKWEETTQYNLALDFGLFNNRLTGTIDGYYRETEDLISRVPPAAGSNLTDILLTNVGQVTSRGLELSLNGVIAQKENFGWDTNFNITFQQQEITRLNLNNDPNFTLPGPNGGISGGVGNNIQILKPGFDPTTFFVFRQVYDTDGNPIEGSYVDVNGDNQITEADRQAYKKATPDAFIGFTNNFRYKNLDLNFTFRGSFGNYVYNNSASDRGNANAVVNQPGYQANAHASFLDTGFTNQNLFSDLYIERADFIRLDNLSIGYTIPFSKMTLRTSLTATNLFVITEYDGLDPEIANGIENNFYPRTRDIVLGLNFTF